MSFNLEMPLPCLRMEQSSGCWVNITFCMIRARGDVEQVRAGLGLGTLSESGLPSGWEKDPSILS